MNRQGCHIYYHKVNTTFVQGSICVPLQTKLISVQLPGLSSCHSKRFSLSTDEAVIDSPCPSLKKLPWFWIGPSSCLKWLPRLFNPNKTHQMGTVFINLVCIWNWNLSERLCPSNIQSFTVVHTYTKDEMAVYSSEKQALCFSWLFWIFSPCFHSFLA